MRLAVDTKFRGQKIGLKLVEELIKLAKLQGYTVMYLQTRNSFSHAQKLYEKLGFKFLRQRPFDPRTLGTFCNYFSGLQCRCYILRLNQNAR